MSKSKLNYQLETYKQKYLIKIKGYPIKILLKYIKHFFSPVKYNKKKKKQNICTEITKISLPA